MGPLTQNAGTKWNRRESCAVAERRQPGPDYADHESSQLGTQHPGGHPSRRREVLAQLELNRSVARLQQATGTTLPTYQITINK